MSSAFLDLAYFSLLPKLALDHDPSTSDFRVAGIMDMKHQSSLFLRYGLTYLFPLAGLKPQSSHLYFLNS
jgi:hypothetical protein